MASPFMLVLAKRMSNFFDDVDWDEDQNLDAGRSKWFHPYAKDVVNLCVEGLVGFW